MISDSARRGLALACLVALSSAATADDSTWQGEIAALAGSHDNFFFRGEGSPAPSSALWTAQLALERVHDTEAGEWTFGLIGSTVSVSDIDAADYQTFEAGAEFKRGPWKAALTYQKLNNRLFSESGEPVFFDETGIEAWLRYSVNRRVWVRFKAETEDLDFEAAEDGRDADADNYSLTVRMGATDEVAFRVSLLREDRVAVSPENNRTGDGFSLAIEGAPRDDLSYFLRFRSRDRDYEDAPAGESNFGRSDTVDDINFNLRWRFTDSLGLIVRDTYRTGDSTRIDRNFTGNSIEAGVFFLFGGPG